jgi:hypothetical protein
MSTNPADYIITLYIHPDTGPIKDVKLDLMKVEDAVQRSRSSGMGRDEERMRMIGDMLKKRFPDIDPDSNRAAFKGILARLSLAAQFNGIVLRLNGSTLRDNEAGKGNTKGNTKEASSNGTSEEVKREVELLTRKTLELKRQLEIEQQAHRDAKEQCRTLQLKMQQIEHDRSEVFKRNKARFEQLLEELRQKEVAIQRVRDDADAIALKEGSLEMQVRQLDERNKELQKREEELQQQIASIQKELAQHRQSVENAKKVKEQLDKTIQDRDAEIKRLRDIIEGESVEQQQDSFMLGL